MSEWTQGYDFIKPVPRWRVKEAMRQEQDAEAQKRRVAEAREELQFKPGPLGDFATAVQGTSQQIVGDIVSPVVRATGDQELADEINRYGDAVDTVVKERLEGGVVPDIVQDAARGAARSLPPIVAGGRFGGARGAIGTATVMQGNRAITEGRSAGLEGQALVRYVADQMAAEAAIAGAFNKVGLGGIEDTPFKSALRQGFKRATADASIRLGQEIPEELLTEIAQSTTNVASGVDPNALSAEQLEQTVYQTVLQTIFTSGAIEGPRLAAEGARSLRNRRDTSQDADELEMEQARREVEQERARRAEQAEQDPGVPETVTPPAEEQADVPDPALDPGKEVIQSEEVEQELYPQRDVQRGGQGQVTPDSPGPAEGDRLSPEAPVDPGTEGASAPSGPVSISQEISGLEVELEQLEPGRAEKYRQSADRLGWSDEDYLSRLRTYVPELRKRVAEEEQAAADTLPEAPGEDTEVQANTVRPLTLTGHFFQRGATSEERGGGSGARPYGRVFFQEPDVTIEELEQVLEGVDGITSIARLGGGRLEEQGSRFAILVSRRGDWRKTQREINERLGGTRLTDEPGVTRIVPAQADQGQTGTQPDQTGAEPAQTGPRRMEPTEEGRPADGQPIRQGDTFQTNTGRETSPYPKSDSSTNRKAINSERRSQQWLIENATAEAESRGDEFNARQFRSELEDAKKGRLPQGSKDAATLYLFGDYIPEVPRPATRPVGEDRPKRRFGDPEQPQTAPPVSRPDEPATATDTGVEQGEGQEAFILNRDRAVAAVQRDLEETVVPREPRTEEERDQIEFLRSRGKQASFVDGEKTFAGAMDTGSGFILLSGDRATDDIWRTIGHELAHETGLDRVIPIDSKELAEGRKKRLTRSKGKYKRRLEADSALLDREARADIVGEFMRDPAFREKLSRENPTMWERLRDSILKVVGRWTPRNDAQRMVLDELRKQSLAEARGAGQPARTVDSAQQTPDDPPPAGPVRAFHGSDQPLTEIRGYGQDVGFHVGTEGAAKTRLQKTSREGSLNEIEFEPGNLVTVPDPTGWNGANAARGVLVEAGVSEQDRMAVELLSGARISYEANGKESAIQDLDQFEAISDDDTFGDPDPVYREIAQSPVVQEFRAALEAAPEDGRVEYAAENLVPLQTKATYEALRRQGIDTLRYWNRAETDSGEGSWSYALLNPDLVKRVGAQTAPEEAATEATTYTPTPSPIPQDFQEAYDSLPEGDDLKTYFDRPRELQDSQGNYPQTGTPFRANLFTGSGREDQGSIYAEGAEGPALGQGRYTALTEEDARRYGPDVRQVDVALENPLVIDSDDDIDRLAGKRLGRDNRSRNEVLRAARAAAEQAGHDGAVILLPQGDMGPISGQSNKRLREVFGHSQAIEFAPPAPEQAGTVRTSGTGREVLGQSLLGIPAVLRPAANPVLDLNGNETGWRSQETQNGVVLVHPTEDRYERFESSDPRSGTATQRARAEAQAFAIDNPVASDSAQPSGDNLSPAAEEEPQGQADDDDLDALIEREFDAQAEPATDTVSAADSPWSTAKTGQRFQATGYRFGESRLGDETGVFYSEMPEESLYGDRAESPTEVSVDLKNPLVVEGLIPQDGLLEQWAEEGDAEAESLLSQSMGEGLAEKDRYIARKAREMGHDGLVYRGDPMQGGNEVSVFSQEGTRRFGQGEDPGDGGRTRIEQARDKAREDADDLWQQFADQAKDKLKTGLDPDLAKLAVRVAIAEIKAGTLTFAAFAERTANKLPAEMLDRAKPYFEKAWEVANRRGMVEDPAGRFDDVVDRESESEPRRIGTGRYGTPESPNRVALGEFFADHFRSGGSYARIDEARAAAAELLGGRPQKGSQAVKDIDEAVEIGVVQAAEEIVERGLPEEQTYDALVDLYSRQPNLAVRTSTSMREQAYSTPAPLSYLANTQAGIGQSDTVFDSSAGNGMLLITAGEKKANELNESRAESLRARGIETTSMDAAEADFDLAGVTAVSINPPFGTIEQDGRNKMWQVGSIRTDKIDHAITLNSLEAMPDDGKAVIIIGAKGFEKRQPKDNSRRGRAYLKGKGFYDALYDQYNVTDHYSVSGDLYQRQGAGFPVDVIVIEGRGASSRPKPYNITGGGIPAVYNSWQELKDAKILGLDRSADGPVEGGRSPDQQEGVPSPPRGNAQPGPAGEPEGTGRTGDSDAGQRGGSRQPESVGPNRGPSDVPGSGRPEVGRSGTNQDQPGRGQRRQDADDGGEPGGVPAGRTDDDARSDGLEDERSAVQGDQYQTAYTPGSSAKSVDTLIPNNHQTAVAAALEAVAERYGSVDEFVGRELGYEQDALYDAFSAEQIDALGLAIARHKEGKGFVLGDQTGVGKGRVAAGMLVYAKRQGFAPVFLTEKPTLFKDMMRDLTDIGQNQEGSRFEPLMINATSGKDDEVVLDDGRVLKHSRKKADEKLREAVDNFREGNGLVATTKKASKGKPAEKTEYDAIFVTYSQFVTRRGRTVSRHWSMQDLSEKAFFVLDESHNAGGTASQGNDRQNPDDERIPLSQMVRDLISPEDAGVFFSSATYAKRPGVMDLYGKTGMMAATGDDGADLAASIMEGGVPLQQVVSQQLVESGAYLRRERSFDGIEFKPQVYEIDPSGAEQTSGIFRAINRFDKIKQQLLEDFMEDDVTSEGGAVRPDYATGDAALTSTNFSSILWNLTDQMLLANKADAVADEAIESLKRGEAPLIYVDSTMEAALNRYIESAGVEAGDAVDFSFRDLLQRYLDRSREVLVQRDVEDSDSYEQHYLTDEQLGEKGLAAFNEAQDLIDSFDADMPASPIDWIRKRIEDAGYSFGEYTGRSFVMNYTGPNAATLEKRPADEVGAANRIEMVRRFNSGELDVILFNQSGSTGISLHASEKNPPAGQKPRHMIIGQPSGNIDTFMQSLGRAHRTGQVNLPRFTLAMTNLPSEIRPASVLVKKLASLNANVTASDKGSVSFDVPDVMNRIGDRVVAEHLSEHEALNRALNEGKEEGLVTSGRNGRLDYDEGLARKASGRLAIMPLSEQQQFWDSVTESFNDIIEELDRMGANPLSAQVTELDARTVESVPVFEGDPDADNAFERPAFIEKVIARRPGEPMKPEEVRKAVTDFYGLDESAGEQQIQDAASKWRRERIAEIREAVANRLETAERNNPDEDAEARMRRRDREGQQETNFRNMVNAFTPGTSVSVWEGGATETLEVIPAVVLKVERKGKGGHPASLSKWRAEIAMGSPDRVVRMSLSQLRSGMEQTDETGGEQEREGWTFFPNRNFIDQDVLNDFAQSEVSTVETRHIGTGNILAAFNTFRKSRGRVTFFRDSEGNLRRGVLLPRSFNLDRWAKDRPVVFDDIGHIRQFLSAGNYLVTPDSALNVIMLRGQLVLRAPKSRSRGGKYTLSQDILQASAPEEFVSIGARMEMVIDGVEQQDRVLEAILSIASLQATQEKDMARRIKGEGGDGTPEVVRAFSESGDNLSPRKIGAPAPEEKQADPVRQADIVTTWGRLFDVPIRRGGFRSKMGKGRIRQGIHKHLEDIIRMREGNAFDMIVASHEIGHHIDKVLNLFSRKGTNGVTEDRDSKLAELKKKDRKRYLKVKGQLQALDYEPGGNRVYEGIAEAVRQIITGTAKNARLGPDAVAWVEEQIMSDAKFGPAMKEAVKQAKQYQDQGAVSRARQVFGGPPIDLSDRARIEKRRRDLVRSFYTMTVDRRYAVKELSDAIKESKPLGDDEASLYETVSVYDARVNSMAAKAVSEGVHTLDGQMLRDESLQDAIKLLKEGEKANDADAYMVARFGLTMPESYNFGMDRQDAQEYIDWVESDPDRAARWQEYHRIHTDFFNDFIELEVRYGNVSREEAERILGQNRDLYVPLMREMGDDRMPSRLGGSSQLVELPKAFRKRTKEGSGRPIKPMLEQAMRRARHHYGRVLRQDIHNRLVRQIRDRENLGAWIDKIDPGTIVNEVSIDSILGQLVDRGVVDQDAANAMREAANVRQGAVLTEDAVRRLSDYYEIDDSLSPDELESAVMRELSKEPDIEDMVFTYKPDYRRPSGWYVIKVIGKDGSPALYEVDPALYESLEATIPEVSNLITKGLDMGGRMFKAGAVGYNTGFLVNNLFRDAGTFAVNSDFVEGSDLATKSWEWTARYAAAVSGKKPNELVDIYREYGGELYNYLAVDDRSMKKTMRRLGGQSGAERIAKAKGGFGKAKETADVFGDGLENAADYLRTLTAMSDVGPRLAEAEGYLKSRGIEIRDGKFVDAETGKKRNPTRDQVIKAMYAASDVTYNYRRRGKIINMVERIFPFTNAAIQSLDKTVRAYRQASKVGSSNEQLRKLARQKFIALMTLNSIYFALKYLMLDEDEELDQWEKDGYVTIKAPGMTGRWSVGMSREHAWITNAATAGLRHFLKNDKDAARDWFRQEVNMRVPFGLSGPVGTGIESVANYDSFRRRSIEPEHLRSGSSAVSPQYRYDEYTSEASKFIGSVTGLSPMKIDHGLSGLTGGAYRRLAQTGERITVPMLQAMGLAEDADTQPLSFRDIPFARGVYRDDTPNASVSDFYDRKSETHIAINDSVKAGVEPSEELVKQKESYQIAATLLKLLSEASSAEYDPSQHKVALARNALGMDDHPNYPNPLYTEVPEEVEKALQDAVFNDLDDVSRDLGRPTRKPEDTDEEYAEAVRVHEANLEGKREFWSRYADSPIVQEAVKQLKRKDVFRELLRGKGRPSFEGKSPAQFKGEMERFQQRRKAAAEFRRFGELVEQD